MVEFLDLLAKDDVHYLNTLGSPVDSRMGLWVASLLGLLQVDGGEELPPPRERGSTPFPDVMCCKEVVPPYTTWEMDDLCEAVDEFNEVVDSVRRANAMVTPTTIADKASKAVREVAKSLKGCKPKGLLPRHQDELCGKCGGMDHDTDECGQTYSQGLAIKADKGQYIYDDKAVEMYALTAVIISIAGVDKGGEHRTIAK